MANPLGKSAVVNGQHLRLVTPDGLPHSERSDEALMLDHGKGDERAFEELLWSSARHEPVHH